MYRFVIVLFLSTVYAQLKINGTCDLTKITFDTEIANKIAGKWYEIERIPNSIEKGDCSHSTVEIANPTVGVSTSEVVEGKLVLRNASILGTLKPRVFDIVIFHGVAQDVLVLGTDYTEYLMLYRCQNTSNSTATISAWKLGRNTTYSVYANKTTQMLATNANIANTTWKVVDHSEAACKLKGGAVNLQISPLLLLLLGLIGLGKVE